MKSEKKERKGKKGRDGKERREERGAKEGRSGGESSEEGKKRELKGSEEERKRLVRAWCFLGNPPPRRLLTQGVFCRVVHLLQRVFSLILRANKSVFLFRAKPAPHLFSGGRSFFLHHLSTKPTPHLF